MIDIHTHILFGVDDGAQTLEESLVLIEHQIKKGYTELYLTPHMISGSLQTASKEKIQQNFEILLAEVSKRNLAIKLNLGAEIYYVHDVLKRIKNNEYFSMGASNRYLIEFSSSRKQFDVDELIYNASLDNIEIIIAHPERYTQASLQEIIELRNLGALIQVNQSSLDGRSGHTIQKRAKKLIKLKVVDFIASDIHHLKK